MADVREVFPILADSATGAGEPAISRIEGEAAAAMEGLIGFSFKDSSGNVVLPQLTAEGKIPVDTEGVAGTCYSAQGEVSAGSTTLADVATITALVNKTYSTFGVIASSKRSSLWQLQYVDDAGGSPTTTVLAEYVTGPGNMTVIGEITCLQQDTTGGTGTQEFKLQGKNFHIQSSLRGTLAMLET